MEPGGSKPHSQEHCNNSYPEPNQPNYPHYIRSPFTSSLMVITSWPFAIFDYNSLLYFCLLIPL